MTTATATAITIPLTATGGAASEDLRLLESTLAHLDELRGVVQSLLERAGRPRHAAPAAPPPSPVFLTTRESEVLGLVARGLSNRLISRELHVTEKTVKNHLSSVYVKIGVRDRTQAALYAVANGLAAA